MRNWPIVLVLLASLTAASAQTLDWSAVESLHPGTLIAVRTGQQARCYLESATSETLTCTRLLIGANVNNRPNPRLVFQRKDILDVRKVPIDMSKGFLNMIAAVGTGGGLDSTGQPTVVAGGKLGGTFTLDLQYDRLQGHNGFSTGGSAVIPLFRVPGPQLDPKKHYIKLYAEPGIGYRAGGGSFGFYSSAQLLVMLISDERWEKRTPYIEFQHRFPLDSPLQGDNRLSIGILFAICRACDVGSN